VTAATPSLVEGEESDQPNRDARCEITVADVRDAERIRDFFNVIAQQARSGVERSQRERDGDKRDEGLADLHGHAEA
jgi:hypothetical protein